MKILKFGGKSLANGPGIDQVVNQILKIQKNEKCVVVVSARSNSTDLLQAMMDAAAEGEEYHKLLKEFKNNQKHPRLDLNFAAEYHNLTQWLEGIAILGEYTPKVRDRILSIGEIISARTVAALLVSYGVAALAVDSRQFLVTENVQGEAVPIDDLSRKKSQQFYHTYSEKLLIVTGFIAQDHTGYTTTLGRNGSNYTAALLANYLKATEVLNFSHVDGIYTMDPQIVPEAKKIKKLSYDEANELANFGTNILHAKTMIPLIQANIRLRLLNTFNPEDKGTLIYGKNDQEGIRAISVKQHLAIITLEGKGMLGTIGIDGRIFETMRKATINVGIISQGSSERNISFVVEESKAEQAKDLLLCEFQADIDRKNVSNVSVRPNIAVISVIGQDLAGFVKAYQNLVKNNCTPLIINNTLSGKNIGLVVDQTVVQKTSRLIHGQIFGTHKTVHVIVFGLGTVGTALLRQILCHQKSLFHRQQIDLKLIGLADSKNLIIKKSGFSENWQKEFKEDPDSYSLEELYRYIRENELFNLIAVDATASSTFINSYPDLIINGFDLIAANKIANTVSFSFYTKVRSLLKKYGKSYLYETNVGAGLPLIDTIRLLHQSGDNIQKIRGVFSGSLSYLFNTYSVEDIPFSQILKEAMKLGLTEPDPREDLSGNDVARKLLILARELDLPLEFKDIQITSLVPEELREKSLSNFLEATDSIDNYFKQKKESCGKDQVLRYIGELDVSSKTLNVSLISVEASSSLGQVTGTDAIFEIFTETYGNDPMIIKGAGAGAEVTARGVFGDILKIVSRL